MGARVALSNADGPPRRVNDFQPTEAADRSFPVSKGEHRIHVAKRFLFLCVAVCVRLCVCVVAYVYEFFL